MKIKIPACLIQARIFILQAYKFSGANKVVQGIEE